LKGYWVLWESPILDEELLRKKWEIVLPRSRGNKVLQKIHKKNWDLQKYVERQSENIWGGSFKMEQSHFV